MKNSKTWKARKLNYLELCYSQKLDAYRGHNDDRQLYVNLYEQIVNAINSLPDDPHVYIRNAMNHQISEDLKTLDRIIENQRNI